MDQEAQSITLEETPLEESPRQTVSKKKKFGRKDSKPNSAHSCVGDNTSKVIIESPLF